MGVRAFRKLLPNIPHVVVFDTSFHQTMPESSYLYSLPYNYYEDFGIRKYGFHGTSHKYVSRRAADILENLLKNYVLFLVILVMVRQLQQLMVGNLSIHQWASLH